MNNLNLIIAVIIYLVITVFIAYKVNKLDDKEGNFLSKYYLGNRSMGAFVLAMTIVSTYIGASSFIGGPALAFKYGLSWVLLACIQIPVIFLTLGLVGKKIALISRKIKAFTVVEIIKARYENKFLVLLLSLLLLIFLISSTVSQFVGGARLFESLLNLDYKIGLTIFVFVVIFYTSFGGFRAVTITDAFQGLVMMLATLVLLFVLISKGGGLEHIMKTIASTSPDLVTPDSGGNIARPFIMSFWILVGLGIVGVPATLVRSMGFKNSKALHNAMIIGTFTIGFLLIGMHLIGVIGIGLEPNLNVGDKLIPTLAIKYLNPVLVGIFIGGPVAAIMSSVDSILIIASSVIVKDIYLNYINPKAEEKKIKKLSFYSSIIIGLLTYLLALNPPSLVVWINLFALSGQEVLFFIPIIMGLYWERGNDKGAIASVFAGFITFMFLEISKISVFGLNNIVPSLTACLLAYIVFSLLSKKNSDKAIEIFFK